MPLTRIEHEQLATAIQEMLSIGDPEDSLYVKKRSVLFLISKYTEEFYEEYNQPGSLHPIGYYPIGEVDPEKYGGTD